MLFMVIPRSYHCCAVLLLSVSVVSRVKKTVRRTDKTEKKYWFEDFEKKLIAATALRCASKLKLFYLKC